MAKQNNIDTYINATRETNSIEFKERFDVSSLQDWCEIIKDIVAVANSGGGVLLFGVNDKGVTIDYDVKPILELDNATVVDKIYKYTGEQFDKVEIMEVVREEKKVAVMLIKCPIIPLVFICEGGYNDHNNKAKRAFMAGSICFRHGAKSEPLNSRDLEQFIERRIDEIKKSWFEGIRKVVEAPTGYQVKVLPPEVIESNSANATPIRIVDDKDAPTYRRVDFRETAIRIVNDDSAPLFRRLNTDKTHPYKSKGVVEIINRKLNGLKTINTHDIKCIAEIHNLKDNPNIYYRSKFATTPQYSDAFVDWVLEKYNIDSRFFDKARLQFRQTRKDAIGSHKRSGMYYYFCTYTTVNVSSSFRKKYNIPDEMIDFRIICKANSMSEANYNASSIIGKKDIFKNDYTNITPSKDEIAKCKQLDFILQVEEHIYVNIKEAIN